MTRPLLIALVGCGSWGVHILRDLKTLGANVIVVARSPGTYGRAKTHGADRIVACIEALPMAIDGAVVATRSDSHSDVILQLARFAIPIFVEKPLGVTLEACHDVTRACPNRVFVMEKWRYHPGVEKMKELADQGRLGRILGISTVRVGWSMIHSELDAVWHLLPHDLSIVDHVLSFLPKPVASFGDPLGSPGSGMLAFLGAGPEPRISIHVSSNHPANRRSIVVSGSEGVISLSGSYDEALALKVGQPSARDAREERLPISSRLPLLAELERFLGYLRGGPAPLAPAEDSIPMVAAILELRQLAGLDQQGV